MAFSKRHVREIAVIRILLDKHDLFLTDRLDDRTCNSCFAGTSPAADTDYHKVNSNRINRIGRI